MAYHLLINIIGPKMEPCGTPLSTFNHSYLKQPSINLFPPNKKVLDPLKKVSRYTTTTKLRNQMVEWDRIKGLSKVKVYTKYQ